MKLQIAFDRLELNEYLNMLSEIEPYLDIVEIGTSLIKDYGNTAIEETRKRTRKLILADLKTMDQGAYEFNSAFDHGADIATVMGVASIQTIQACYDVCMERGKGMMIDLMEVQQTRLDELLQFSQSYFCMHTPTDGATNSQELDIENLPNLCFAGGIDKSVLKRLKTNNVAAIVVVGSAITKSTNKINAAKEYYDLVHS